MWRDLDGLPRYRSNFTVTTRRYPVRVHVHDDLARVWAEFDDARLESTLFEYLWLAVNSPNSHANRIGQLIAEAERRGKPKLVESAKKRAEITPASNKK